MLKQQCDNPDALTFTLNSALRQSFCTSKTCFLTVGNNPGYTIGVKHGENGKYFIIDSHSRNCDGISSPDGTAVTLEVSGESELNKYVHDITRSVFENDVPFEVTPVCISGRRATNNRIGEVCHRSGLPEQSCEYEINDSLESGSQSVEDTDTTCGIPDDSSTERHGGQESGNQDIELNVNVNYDTYEPSPDVLDSGQRVGNPAVEERSSTVPNMIDIGNINLGDCSDDIKYSLINNRIPEHGFEFPTKLYKDNRCKTGYFSRKFNKEWFTMFEFISYSKTKNGLYCLACKLFPDTAHRRPKKIISEPYDNWKDTVADLKHHASCEYHCNSMARLESFVRSSENPAARIDTNINSGSAMLMEQNRNILKSVLACIEFCGRRGIALRGHRDDDTHVELNTNMGNFYNKELINFRVDAGDKVLQDHLKHCSKNASYISKTTQNELLYCIKIFIQNKIVDEIRRQPFGALFGYQYDEVTDSSNWEQLGLVIRYVKDKRPVERLLEFVQTEETTGQALCQHIITSLTDVGPVDPKRWTGQGICLAKTWGAPLSLQDNHHELCTTIALVMS